jgi:hypothetical protein
MKSGAGGFRGIVPLVNAQFVNPAAWGRLARLSRESARIAVAPYFMYSLANVSTGQAVAAAFADSDEVLKSGVAAAALGGKGVAAYEVNFHTTEGDAPAELRNLAVSGAHSGPALARRLLQGALNGVREQAVYSLAGFDSYTGTRSLVRLWGITRDLAPGRLRPTGLAVGMLNSAVGGDAYASTCSGASDTCNTLVAAWFVDAKRTNLVVVSSAGASQRIQTGLPCSRRFALQVLDGSDPEANNESVNPKGGGGVSVVPGKAGCDGSWAFDLPPHSLAVLLESKSENAAPQPRRPKLP